MVNRINKGFSIVVMLTVLLFCFGCSGTKYSQKPDYSGIKDYYKAHDNKFGIEPEMEDCFSEISTAHPGLDSLLPENSILKQIVIIRHARVAVSKSGLYNYAKAYEYVNDYDTSDIHPIWGGNESSQIPLKVYCSKLKRSIQTSRQLFGNDILLIEDPLFNEFQREIIPIPLVKMPLDFWLYPSRILWMMGVTSPEIETFREARNRAGDAALKLISIADEEKSLILVAHGFINYYIGKKLEKEGWQHVRNGGSENLAVNIYVKIE